MAKCPIVFQHINIGVSDSWRIAFIKSHVRVVLRPRLTWEVIPRFLFSRLSTCSIGRHTEYSSGSRSLFLLCHICKNYLANGCPIPQGSTLFEMEEPVAFSSIPIH